MTAEHLDKKPFLDLLRSMSTAQVWAVLVALTGLIGGAVSVGYEVGKVGADIHDSEAQRDHFDARAYREKSEFLELYLRYILAVENERYYFDETEKVELTKKRIEVETQLFAKTKLLRERASDSTVYEIRNRGAAVSKGSDDATIRFFDGSSFPLPERVAAYVNGRPPQNPQVPAVDSTPNR